MELNTTKQTIEVENTIGDESLQMPLRAETMVPGAGREAVEVLMEDATVSLGAVEVQSDRIVLDGILYCQAVYRQGEDPAARALTAQKTFNQVIDMPGAMAKMICRAHGTVDHIQAAYANGHIVFDVVIGLRAQVTALEPVELIATVGGVDGLEAQFDELCSVKLSAEAETQALLREEVAMPSELDARISLMDWYTVKVSGITPDIGGVRVAGEVQTETLIGTGIAGRPAALVKVGMPFDQLVELPDWLTNDVTGDVTLRRMSSSLQSDATGEETRLVLEAEMAFAIRAAGQDSIVALTDAYTTGDMQIVTEAVQLNLCGGSTQFTETESFKGTILLPEGAPSVGTVLATRVRPALSGWEVRDGYTTLEGVLEAGVLYLPTGSDQLSAARSEIAFTIRVLGDVPQDAWIDVEATAAEAAALMNDRLELRCVLNVSGMSRSTKTGQAVRAIRTEAAPARPRGMVLVWPSNEDSLWSIGKKYRLSSAEIARINRFIPCAGILATRTLSKPPYARRWLQAARSLCPQMGRPSR